MAKALSEILGRQLRTSEGKSDSRRKLINAVRAASARMQLGDADRRAIQLDVTGKASMGDMSLAEIGKVLDRLNRDRPAPMGHRAHVAKVKALWWTCYWLGITDQANDAALDAFVHRQTGLSSIRFVDHRRAPALIEALKAMAARAGVRWATEAEVAEVAAHNPGVTRATVDRDHVLRAIWDKLRELGGAIAISPHAYLHKAGIVSNPLNHWAWSSAEQDAAIRLLGKQLRRLLAKAGD